MGESMRLRTVLSIFHERAGPRSGSFRPGIALACVPRELAALGCRRSPGTRGDRNMENATGRKGRGGHLGDRTSRDLPVAVDVQLTLRDEMADHAVVG